MAWSIGKGYNYNSQRCIVSDDPEAMTVSRDRDSDREYYGGTLIAESVHPENAALIAAAPELYRALNMVLSRLRDHSEDWGDEADAGYAAIAKAEGRK